MDAPPNETPPFRCPIDNCLTAYPSLQSMRRHVSRGHKTRFVEGSVVQEARPRLAPLLAARTVPDSNLPSPPSLRGHNGEEPAASASPLPATVTPSSATGTSASTTNHHGRGPVSSQSVQAQTPVRSGGTNARIVYSGGDFIWSEESDEYMGRIVIRHDYLYPTQGEDHQQRMKWIFDEFWQGYGFSATDYRLRDPTLLEMFDTRLAQVQAVLRYRLATSTEQTQPPSTTTSSSNGPPQNGNVNVDPPPANSPPASAAVSPPPTPVSGHPRGLAIISNWLTSDAESQRRTFHQLLQSAKDLAGLKEEWKDFMDKEESSRNANAAVVPAANAESVSYVESISATSPLFTPPVENDPSDLRTLIQTKLREERLKRKRELEAQGHGQMLDGLGLPKKIKAEPIVLSP